jgi:hypothetical protein
VKNNKSREKLFWLFPFHIALDTVKLPDDKITPASIHEKLVFLALFMPISFSQEPCCVEEGDQKNGRMRTTGTSQNDLFLKIYERIVVQKFS